jgi:hypothetical protein
MRKILIIILLSGLFSQGVWMMNDRTHSELDWQTKKTSHFNIHYHNGIEDIAIKGATIAEQVIPILMTQMGMDTLPILDIIFTNEDEVMNGYAMFTNQTFIWVDQNDASIWLENQKWLYQVLSHELQHLVFMNAVRTWMPEPWSMSLFGQIPSWFVEGLAEYYTEKWRPHRADINHKYHVLTNSMDKMDPHHDGYSKVLYLAEKFSDDTIVKIVQYRNDYKLYDFEEAFKKATGVSIDKFEEDWRRTMNTYYYGYRSQKEAIEELGNTLTLPVKKVSTFLISSDSSKIAIVGRDDLGQYDNSLILATRKKKNEKKKWFSVDFNSLFFSGKKDTIKKWKKPQFDKKEIDYGRFHAHLSWSNDNNKIAYSKYRRGNHGSMIWDIKTFDIITKKSKWITNSMRATYPTWVNNDTEIIFIAHYNSTAQFYKLDIKTNEITQMTNYEGDVSIFTPSLSPDQNSITFAMAPENGNSDLYLLNLKTLFVERLTEHPAVDYLPIWEPSGKRIAYTSHRSSTPNIHLIDVKGKETTQITDVGDAVWTHQWTPNDSTLLLKTLGDTDTTRLVAINLNRKLTTEKLSIRNRYSSWMTKSPDNILHPVDYSNIPQLTSAKKYNFIKHIKHLTSVVLPFPIPVANTAWTDALGKHQLFINIGSLDYEMRYPFGGISYTNASNGPFWGFAYNNDQDFKYRNYDQSSNGLIEIKNGITLWTRTPYNSGENLSSNHNFSSSLFIGNIKISPLFDYKDSTLENGLDTIIAIDHILKNLPEPEDGKLGKISFGYTYLSRRNHKLNNFFPQQGYGIKFQFDIAHKKIFSDFNYSQISFDGFNNFKMGEIVFYSRLKGISQFGKPPAQDQLNFSTDEATYFPTIGVSESFPENINLRGSSQYRFGDILLFGSLELRQKLKGGDLPINILGFTIGDISSAIISDFGNIWDGEVKSGDFISTAGHEIKFSFKSGGFPIMTFASGYANEIKNIQKLDDLNYYYRLVLINPF